MRGGLYGVECGVMSANASNRCVIGLGRLRSVSARGGGVSTLSYRHRDNNSEQASLSTPHVSLSGALKKRLVPASSYRTAALNLD